MAGPGSAVICGKATRSGARPCGNRSRHPKPSLQTALHDPSPAQREHRRRDRAVPGRTGRHPPAVEPAGRPRRPGDHGRGLPGQRLRHHDRLPPPADPPGVRDLQAAEVPVRGAGLDGGPGAGHPLGGRPPQAPRPHRRGGRPPLTARGPRQRAGRPVARPRGLAVGEQRHRGRQEVRPRPARGPRACASSAATSCCGWPWGC